MNCFYHPTVVAIGTCKSCGKGLCFESVVDLGRGLACRGVCEEDVTKLTGLIQRNIERDPLNQQLLGAAKANRYLGVAFYLAFGALFVGFAVVKYFVSGYQTPDMLLSLMGGLFLVFGFILLQRTRRLTKMK